MLRITQLDEFGNVSWDVEFLYENDVLLVVMAENDLEVITASQVWKEDLIKAIVINTVVED